MTPELLRLDRLVVEVVHTAQWREHGGVPGIRSQQALVSALRHGPRLDLPRLAAAYGCAICRKRPFRDGNERLALLAMLTVLGLNGWELDASEPAVLVLMRNISAGRLRKRGVAAWIRNRLREARR